MPPLSCRHVLASITDQGAGPSYSVRALARHLAEAGLATAIDSVAGWRGSPAETSADSRIETKAYPRSTLPLLAAACGSPDMARALAEHARGTDILHTHGLWLMPNVYPSWAARGDGARARVVLSPRGMLGAAALAFSSIKKRLFWMLLQRRAMASVSLLHATSEAEYQDIRAFGLTAPVALIPNGVELPPKSANEGGDPARSRTVLYLGRLHPKKGLDTLLQAWATVEPRRPDWRLRIVGPAEGGHDAELRALSARLNLRNAAIEGPAYGDARLAAYRDASVFVLPTRHENFAMTVAEALAAGTPAVSTKGAPWAGLVDERCGWWIDHGADALAAALEDATSRPAPELAEMGRRGRAWMARDFGWPRMAQDMADAYRWLAQGGERPATIRMT